MNERSFLVNQIEARADRVLFAYLGDLGDGHAFELFQRRRIQARCHNPFPTAVLVDVLNELGVFHDTLTK